MKLHNELDAVNGMLAKVSKELNKAQGDKQEMLTINFVKFGNHILSHRHLPMSFQK
jgi:hypothetical protein